MAEEYEIEGLVNLEAKSINNKNCKFDIIDESSVSDNNEDISKIEIRSEEVQEILGATPRWIIRAGISVILAVVVALLIGSWFLNILMLLVLKLP